MKYESKADIFKLKFEKSPKILDLIFSEIGSFDNEFPGIKPEFCS